jgi:nitrogen fixation protein NifZ
MIEAREAKFRWGQAVQAAEHLYDDGTLPGVPEGTLLVAAGGPGEIVQVGHHAEANVPIYLVDFGVVVLGCLEEELVHADAAVGAAAPQPDAPQGAT